MVELNIGEIVERIRTLFAQGKQFVFWYDANADFADNIGEITAQLTQTTIEMLPGEQFKTKLKVLSLEKNGEAALIYSPAKKPDLSQNLMADVERYSVEFTADATVMLREELGLEEKYQQFVVDNMKFFGNKERINKFKVLANGRRINNPIIVILAVLAKSNGISSLDILKSVIQTDLEENQALNEFKKFNVYDYFWQGMSIQFGYFSSEPKLKELLSGMLVITAFDQMELDLPSQVNVYQTFAKANVIAAVSQLMNMANFTSRMKQIADEVWQFINGESVFKNVEMNDLIKSDVFRNFDLKIMDWLATSLVNSELQPNGVDLRSLTHARQDTMYGNEYETAYKMIRKAIPVLAGKAFHKYENVERFAEAYVDTKNGLANIDTSYRKFVDYRWTLDSELFDSFDTLAQRVEQSYLNGFLNPMIKRWSDVYDIKSIESQKLQRNFYRNKVASSKNPVVVIVSDALRFEAGQDLAKFINRENQLSAEVDYMITGVPSVTYFGMPSLLPYDELTYDASVPTVLVDGVKATDLASRELVLQKRNAKSMTIAADKVMSTKTEDLKSEFVGKDVIYVYHNGIDAISDNAKTERKTFEATAQTVSEIQSIIKRLRSANRTNFIVTADHGFIYRDSELDTTDKIDLKPADFMKKAPRYAISKEKFEQTGVDSVVISDVLDNDQEEMVYYPTSANIFMSQGAGKNYVHGGVSPQEMIVPVIAVHSKRGADTSETVEVQLSPVPHRITSRTIIVSFNQLQPISSDVNGATFEAKFVDQTGDVISSTEVINAFSDDQNPSKRIIKKRFVIEDQVYDQTQNYYLIVENVENKQEIIREEFTMDLAITGGFDFDFS
ncbi:BREX-1 system phosphatase PglZ type A [Weissella cibaria]|uniref:BREX-1 system phosphatase PglZ type A n=1 Tax=Weissella cibaria TaxID=137591 RepID=UPI001896C838|nr:BREX-1 system phosphatase PglZ type A [Weissella cibaria]